MAPPQDDLENTLEQALALHRQGALTEAAALYRDVLTRSPAHPDALHFLGLVHHQQGKHGEALELIERALAAAPAADSMRLNLALVQTAAGRFADAATTFEALRERRGDDPQVLNGLAVALKGAGDSAAAENVLRELTGLYPTFAGGHYNLGNLLLLQGRASDAAAAFEAALALSPGDADTKRNLAAALQSTGRLDRAREILESLVTANGGDAAALNNLGNLRRQQGARTEAENLLRRAVAADPASADAAYNLGALLADRNATEDAVASFQRAHGLRPGFAKADWAAALALPQIYASTDQRDDYRERWFAGVRRIAEAPLPATPDAVRAELAAFAEITPFALAYQGGDARDAMTLWGERCAAVATLAFPDLAEPPAVPAGPRRRVGFVSAHFRAHTVERLFSAWIEGADRDALETHLISTAGPGDARTRELAARVDGAHLHAMDIGELARLIRHLACDVLIYPDVGMDPRTQILAALPLAPRQWMAWGHPVTSGLPTVEAFLTSALMEPEDGDAHYRERLVRLPGLSVRYTRPAPASGDIPHHPFLCAQSLFKAPPEQDRAFAEIVKACPGANLAFFAHPIDAVTAAFRDRLGAVFARAGLDPDEALVFIPPCDRGTFLRHLAGAQVILDTFSWSGGNTSLESFAMGRPVVTLPGRFMRGRHTAAMLDVMDLPALKAGDAIEFAEIAIGLATDAGRRHDMEGAIRDRAACLFGDDAPVAALIELLRGS